MSRYVLMRLLQAVPLLFGIAAITFFIVDMAPGDPMDVYMEQRYRREVDPQVIELIRKYGLDQPLHTQYIKWIGFHRKLLFSKSPLERFFDELKCQRSRSQSRQRAARLYG